MLDWIRANAPDLRLGKRIEGEHRICYARFSFEGLTFDLRAGGPDVQDPDDEIVRLCEAALRKAMKLPNAPGRTQQVGIEQAIIAAELSGDAGLVAHLTQELMNGTPKQSAFNPPIPTKWGTRTL